MYAARSERRQPRGRYSFLGQGSNWQDPAAVARGRASPVGGTDDWYAYMVSERISEGWTVADALAWEQAHRAGSAAWAASGTPNLINTGQWGNVGAIGYTSGPQGGSGWVQTPAGELRDVRTGEVLPRVPGSLTMEEAAAAEAVRREEARARANPIPEGFYLDPRVNQQWLEDNAIDVGGAEVAEEGPEQGTAELSGVAKAGLGFLALGLLFAGRKRRRR